MCDILNRLIEERAQEVRDEMKSALEVKDKEMKYALEVKDKEMQQAMKEKEQEINHVKSENDRKDRTFVTFLLKNGYNQISTITELAKVEKPFVLQIAKELNIEVTI